MNINNIAIVRATNVIPFDGVVRPVSEVPYLKKEQGTEFSFAMSDLLKKQGKLKQVDWSKPEEINEINQKNNEILEQYVPYSSGYNSMVLWALNGLVPDDINNTFSNKDCVIVDGLAEQIEKTEIVSLVPTDTAIKGSVEVSEQGVLFIKKDRYDSLSQTNKERISNLNFSVKIIEGELEEEVRSYLEKSGRYTAETLSLSRKDRGYIESETSNELIKTINDVAEENNIAQALHYSIFTWESGIDVEKLQSVKDEYKNTWTVINFYKQTFFDYLLPRIDIKNSVKANADSYPESPVYMKDLCDEIEEKVGIEEYKKLLDAYNGALEKLRDSGRLYTPQQIVDAKKQKKQIDLLTLIEEVIKQEQSKEKSAPKTWWELSPTQKQNIQKGQIQIGQAHGENLGDSEVIENTSVENAIE